MLIRNAELDGIRVGDLRCEHGVIVEIGSALSTRSEEAVIEARRSALLPALHDHHIHFMAFAAARSSVPCGPPHVHTAKELAQALAMHAPITGTNSGTWLRGVGYHPSVAGDIDRHWLDRHVAHRPLRIQHRSGRLWIFNSLGLERLGSVGDSPLETINGAPTGRLYDADLWLRERLGSIAPDVRAASLELARHGVVTLTDTTPNNNLANADHFARLQKQGDLLQDLVLMGNDSLDHLKTQGRLRRGARKMHLHESALPDLDVLCQQIRSSHAAARPVAVHCVTLVELLFTLTAFELAGTLRGDRIEHAGIAPPEAVAQLVRLGLGVVTQPHFVSERGEVYLSEVEPADLPWLYRLHGFAQAGIPLAGGTDAPFGDANPWKAMDAAVQRQTPAGHTLGAEERLTPEAALGLFLPTALTSNGRPPLRVGAPADLMLLDRPWHAARAQLAKVEVVHTFRRGETIWSAETP